jgi:uncharacterized protein YyaL (SSP411 family)
MTARAGRNRLDEEESPYLRQHADNPVHWQPWDEAALAEARERDVPIFLSVGYSACHWCHVMEEESFEDETVASVLNEEFVPIKVDREERPDLDRVYQTICGLVSGRGGWPLSVFLTPDGEPFFVGTYFPKEPRQNMPGFEGLCRDIANSWAEDREEILNRADQWTAALTDELEDVPDAGGSPPDAEVLGGATEAVLRSADREHGGFGSGGPKFPQPPRLHLLLRAWAVTGDAEPLGVAERTLDAMATGGLYDHVGGGFHRYATDRDWTVPHFEKMLYDNAELPRAYLAAAQATGRDGYRTVAAETFGFLEREMRHPEGGFYSTLDARSEGREGAYYVWTPDAVRDAMGDDLADLFCARFGVDDAGNFEGETVLTAARSVEDLAAEFELDSAEIEERLIDARLAAHAARSERERPARDEKVLASWNGLAVSSYAAGGRALSPTLADTGASALSFVRDRLWDDGARRLSRRWKDGDLKGDGYLEDYAFLARGAFDLYQATGDVDHLGFALDLADVVVEEFYDEDRGTLYFTPNSGESLVARPQETGDQSTPSSLGVATDLLLALDHFDPDADYASVATDVLGSHGDRIRGRPTEHVSLALAADVRERGHTELTVAAEGLPESWWRTLSRRYLPMAIVAPRPATQSGLDEWLDELGLAEAPPIWANRAARDGPTVYACRDFTCSPPESDLAAALEWLGENA